MGIRGDVMEVCLLAGEIMLKYGGETYRVEETMELMARSQNLSEVHSFVTPTGIFLSFYSPLAGERTRVIRIKNRAIDLNKVTMVNDLSRRFVEGQLSLDEARTELIQIDQEQMSFPVWQQHLAAGLASGSFAILFGGDLIDLIPAFLAGVLVNMSLLFFEALLRVKFFSELISAFVGGMSSVILYHLGIGVHLDQIIIGSLMPLVPGLAITSAVRDIMAGDLLAGVGRGAEATLTALSVATGIAIVIALFL